MQIQIFLWANWVTLSGSVWLIQTFLHLLEQQKKNCEILQTSQNKQTLVGAHYVLHIITGLVNVLLIFI